jgi:hypothetical protein
MKIKHSKYKNTGILFELLTRQITADTIANKKPHALTILRRYFNDKTFLLKEYRIYNALMTKKYKSDGNATVLLDTLLEAYQKLNKTRLKREKYNLIREIKKYYDLEDFFKAKINDYKVQASIFKILESYHLEDVSPLSIVKAKVTLLEHITEKTLSIKIKKDTILEEFKSYDKDTKLLSYKILLDKFNEKYKNLGENQKLLLKEYVNNVSNSPKLKSYINKEIKSVKKELTEHKNKITDGAVKIKLNEIKGLIQPLCKKSSVNDDNVINLLNYYELVNELKIVTK